MRRLTALLIFLTLAGCNHHEQDSHTEVFKTPEQAIAERRTRQLAAHKELALSVLHFARPDIEAKLADGTSIHVQADGVTRMIDLLPIEEQMVRQSNEERAIVRRFLEEQLKPFDFDRLKSLGFERVKNQTAFELVNTQSLAEMQKSAGKSPIHSVPVMTNLHRVTVIRRDPKGTGVPVTAALLEAWKAPQSELDGAAMQNLRDGLNHSGEPFFDTVAFGPVGNTGNLKSGVDPAVILLPEFLMAVQKAWKTQSNLVVFLPSPTGIVFVEQQNQKLLDLMVPLWKKQLLAMPNPLSDQLLLRDAEKISYSDYTPTTKPATVPATKPKPYIVR
jgi:hypothetical protein